MTAQSPVSSPEAAHPPVQRPLRKKGLSQERIMAVMAACFASGILIYSLLPEGFLRDLSIPVVAFGVCWSMYRTRE